LGCCFITEIVGLTFSFKFASKTKKGCFLEKNGSFGKIKAILTLAPLFFQTKFQVGKTKRHGDFAAANCGIFSIPENWIFVPVQ